MKSKKLDFWLGFLVGLASPVFAVALALDQFPVLKELDDVANPAWNLIVMRAISFGAVVNAAIFFIALSFDRERVSRGILVACIPSVLAVFYFQFIL